MSQYNFFTKSSYSFSQSLLSIDSIIEFAVKNNFKEVFLIETNYLHGVFEFYEKAKRNNLKPIIGLNVRVNDLNTILIAKNFEGLKNLFKISSSISLNIFDESIFLELKNIIEVKEKFPIHAFATSDYNEIFLKINESAQFKDSGFSLLTSDEAKLFLTTKQIEIIDWIKTQVNIVIEPIQPEICNFKNEWIKNESQQYFIDLLNSHLTSFLIQNKIIDTQKYIERLNFEIKVILDKKMENYFLIVSDFINWAKANKILVGPGRGSAPGSLISFLLKITTIDPIKNNLIFERFLNPERKTLPDIDVDVEDSEREKIINYIFNKYGLEYCAQIITFQTLKAKMSIRDVGRMFEIPLKQVDVLAKNASEFSTIEKYYKESKTFSTLVNSSELFKKMIYFASKIEGMPRQHSTHAAGIVISKEKLINIIPIQKSHNNLLLTQIPMENLEQNGLIKIDILGLRNLSFLSEILKQIKISKNINLDIENISFNDDKVFDLLSSGKTAGIFQLESPGMKNVIKKLKINSFEDIVATISLYRPGPMKNIDSFIKRKQAKESIEYLDPSFKPILEMTYGIIVYQEQVMQIAKAFAQFDFAKADLLRIAISKKNTDLLDKLKIDFKNSSLNNNKTPLQIEKVWDLIYSFGDYGFNRSHAFSYSIISYQLAFLKTYYKIEFFQSLFNSINGSSANEKFLLYLEDLKENDIKILPPDINKSNHLFITINDNLYFSFNSLKGISSMKAAEIAEVRNKKGKFDDLLDFLIKTNDIKLSKTNVLTLIKGGCFDEIDNNRTKLIKNLEILFEYLDLIKIEKDNLVFFDKTLIKPPLMVEVEKNTSQIYLDELEVFGFELNNNPLNISSLTSDEVVGIITELKIKQTIYKSNYALLKIKTFDDKTMTLIIWSSLYNKFSSLLKVGKKFNFTLDLKTSKNNSFVVKNIEINKL